MLGMEQLSADDRAVVGRARRLERFLTQPFFATEQFTGIKGKDVSLKDSLDGCERILRDEFKDFPESALYMIGTVDEAKEKAKSAKPDPKDPSKPETTQKAQSNIKPTADSKPKDIAEAATKPGAKPQPETEHAAGTHAS
jgi:F-type H+-transporting ATPase subunit beta